MVVIKTEALSMRGHIYFGARIGAYYAMQFTLLGGVLILWYAIGETLVRSWGALFAVPLALTCSFIAADIWTRVLAPRRQRIAHEYRYWRQAHVLELVLEEDSPDTQRSRV